MIALTENGYDVSTRVTDRRIFNMHALKRCRWQACKT